MTILVVLGVLTILVWPFGFWHPWAVVVTAMLAAAFVGGAVVLWDERHGLTWSGRLEWLRAMRCRWFGIHEPWECHDCVHCRYRGPRVAECERRREITLAAMRGELNVHQYRAAMNERPPIGGAP